MAREQPNVTRHDLQDLLEDRLDPDRQEAVIAALERNPRLRGELENWRKVRESLHAIYDNVLEEPFSPSLRRQVEQLNRALRRR